MVGLGQIRMVMAHTYVFFFLGIALVIEYLLANKPNAIILNLLRWLLILSALYVTYFFYQEGLGMYLFIPMMAISIFLLLELWLNYAIKRVRRVKINGLSGHQLLLQQSHNGRLR
jgi:hypothetical protein